MTKWYGALSGFSELNVVPLQGLGFYFFTSLHSVILHRATPRCNNMTPFQGFNGAFPGFTELKVVPFQGLIMVKEDK
jgi:hypothetical protein